MNRSNNARLSRLVMIASTLSTLATACDDGMMEESATDMDLELVDELELDDEGLLEEGPQPLDDWAEDPELVEVKATDEEKIEEKNEGHDEEKAEETAEALSHGPIPGVGELVDNLEPQLGSLYSVGVIPHTGTCPADSAMVEIHMDDEDNANANSHWGWLGAISQNHNTTFRFCKVDGTKLRPISTYASQQNHYAVLKLGYQCPNGSVEFSRYFDNEDNNNANGSSGDIYPNSSTTNTHLKFCMFRHAIPGEPTMGAFPMYGPGFEYGVFARDFPLAAQSGSLYTDDEDNANANGYSAEGYIQDAQRLVSHGSNTRMYLARVQQAGGGSLNPTWTPWLNRDLPSGSGDWETLAEFVNQGQACPSPLDVQCQTVSGVDWTQTGEPYSCTTNSGGICIKSQQPDGSCQDYRVRFLCP